MWSAIFRRFYVVAMLLHISHAFSPPRGSSRVNNYHNNFHSQQITVAERRHSSIIFAQQDNNNDKNDKPISIRQRIKTTGRIVWERMDTMKSSGLYDNEDGLVPMQSGFKANVGIFVAALLFKWYRARFINKIPMWDRQPQWNMVVTSPEQEKELHAYSCKNCGTTIFIARHREWFFQGGNTKCTNCGATGEDNFEEIREDIVDSIDDDYFDYESPLDFVSAAERRRLVKKAGGDEELAKQMAIDDVMANDKDQVQKSESSGDDKPVKKKKKSSKKKKSPESEKKQPEKKAEPADDLDELDMDF